MRVQLARDLNKLAGPFRWFPHLCPTCFLNSAIVHSFDYVIQPLPPEPIEVFSRSRRHGVEEIERLGVSEGPICDVFVIASCERFFTDKAAQRHEDRRRLRVRGGGPCLIAVVVI
ncbi:hypothetical protein LCGC14_3133400, partial [marine sediment metagenome]